MIVEYGPGCALWFWVYLLKSYQSFMYFSIFKIQSRFSTVGCLLGSPMGLFPKLSYIIISTVYISREALEPFSLRGWILFQSGVSHGERSQAQVGLLLSPQLGPCVLEFFSQ